MCLLIQKHYHGTRASIVAHGMEFIVTRRHDNKSHIPLNLVDFLAGLILIYHIQIFHVKSILKYLIILNYMFFVSRIMIHMGLKLDLTIFNCSLRT
ncbi:hypothetical protein H5410_001160 [Solanum commersonii]|uniref:Uncharacterized protein n=1 Tax=Solanum commersonii TaxID=4109 RepID=A0A9J6AYX6_SOLCO|nr:hypothetical protein H5410_001160 [Solanum commersonii]